MKISIGNFRQILQVIINNGTSIKKTNKKGTNDGTSNKANNPANSKHRLSKFILKSAVVLYPYPSTDYEGLLWSIHRLQWRIQEKRLDPTYLIIHLELLLEDMTSFLDQLRLTDWILTSQIFLIHQGQPYLAHLMHTPEKLFTPLFNENGKNIYTEEQIKKMWIDDTKNFEESYIDMLGYDRDIPDSGSDICSNITWISYLDEGGDKNWNKKDIKPHEICLNFLLREQHNSKLPFQDPKKPAQVANRITYTYMVDDVIDYRNNKTAYFDAYVHPYGSVMDTYVITLIANDPVQTAGAGALFAPFDTMTWILVVCSVLGIVVTFKLLLMSDNRDLLFTLKVFLFSFFLFLGQSSADYSRRLFRPFWRGAPLLALVFVTTFFIKNFYEGELYSSLSLKPIPSYPTGLLELIDAKFPIVSTPEDAQHLKLELEKRTELEKMKQFKVTYKIKDFWDYIKFPEYSSFDTTAMFIINSTHASPLNLENEEKYQLPAEYAIVGKKMSVESHVRLLKALGEKVTVKVEPLVVIKAHKAIMTWRSPLTPTIRRTLGRLDQSGIFQYWQKYGQDYQFLGDFRRLVQNATWRTINRINKGFDTIDRFAKENFHFLYTPKVTPDHKTKWIGVTMDTLRVPFFLYFACMAVASLVFMYEYLGTRMRMILRRWRRVAPMTGEIIPLVSRGVPKVFHPEGDAEQVGDDNAERDQRVDVLGDANVHEFQDPDQINRGGSENHCREIVPYDYKAARRQILNIPICKFEFGTLDLHHG